MLRPVPFPLSPDFLHQLGYDRAVADFGPLHVDDECQPRRFVALYWDSDADQLGWSDGLRGGPRHRSGHRDAARRRAALTIRAPRLGPFTSKTSASSAASSLKRVPNPSRLHQFDGQTSVAVVNVTTSGRVIWPLKRSWMNVSTSSKSALRSSGCISWVPEYDSINLR